jgi:hypothetical protein
MSTDLLVSRAVLTLLEQLKEVLKPFLVPDLLKKSDLLFCERTLPPDTIDRLGG